MPAEICLSSFILIYFFSSVLFGRTKADIFGQHHRNFRGTNTEALELDARAELLVDTTHEQFLSDSQFRRSCL